jgi:hypothetical protein
MWTSLPGSADLRRGFSAERMLNDYVERVDLAAPSR